MNPTSLPPHEQRKLNEQNIRALEPLLDSNLAELANACFGAIKDDPFNAPAYRLLAQALRKSGNLRALPQVGELACNVGLDWISGGCLVDGAAFFREVAEDLPDACGPYAALYRQIELQSAAHRARPAPEPDAGQRRLLLAIPVLDAREAEVLTAYALPSLLAPQNLPAMCRARRLQVEFYTAAGLAEPLRAAAPVQRLAGLAPIEVTPVAPEILASLERRGGAENPRHWIVGAFHYLAVEHARALAADVLYTPPERIYADGTLANFARFIDEGRAAVLLASLPGQAETLRPRLDELRDPATQALSISPRRLAELAMQNLHHTLKDCVLVAGNGTMPRNPTRLIFPHSHGFHVRSVQLYPVLISAAAIRKNVGTGPITAFDRASLESNFTNFFFPRPSDWQALKIVDDSDHGVALDIVPGFSEDSPLTCDLHFEQLLRRSPDDHHFWHFEHRVNFHAEAPIGAIGTFERSQDGALHRTLLPVADRSALADLDLWLTVKQPRPEAA